MLRLRLLGGAAALALFATTSTAQATVCPFGLIFSAWVVGSSQNRELTFNEAMTCGIAALVSQPEPVAKPRKRAKAKKSKS
jgi:hypothetical protein